MKAPFDQRSDGPLSGQQACLANASLPHRQLKALGNKQRLVLVSFLAGGEHSVSELNTHVSLSQSALSQHLSKLRAAGLVRTRRQGQTIYYSLVDGPIRQVIEALQRVFRA